MLAVSATRIGFKIDPVEAILGIAAGLGVVGVLLGILTARRARLAPRLHAGRFLALGAIVAGALCASSVVLLLTIILPAERDAENRRVCAHNLYFAWDQLYCLVDAPDRLFPDSLASFARACFCSPETGNRPKYLHCPSDRQKRGCSYYYVPGYGTDVPPSQILMYDDPANHGGAGGCILYGDGARWVPSPKFEAEINSIKLPDGTPWAPHKTLNPGQATP